MIYESTFTKSKLRQNEREFERERQKRESVATLRGAFRLMAIVVARIFNGFNVGQHDREERERRLSVAALEKAKLEQAAHPASHAAADFAAATPRSLTMLEYGAGGGHSRR